VTQQQQQQQQQQRCGTAVPMRVMYFIMQLYCCTPESLLPAHNAIITCLRVAHLQPMQQDISCRVCSIRQSQALSLAKQNIALPALCAAVQLPVADRVCCICFVPPALQVMTAPIRAFVDMIINMIVGWYLWPSRLTVRPCRGEAALLALLVHDRNHGAGPCAVSDGSWTVRWIVR
jgi:hypothetical protein